MSESHWFYVDDILRMGPVTEGEVINLLKQGKITQETYIWTDGMAEWKSLSESSLSHKVSDLELSLNEIPIIEPEILREEPLTLKPKPWLRYLARQFDMTCVFFVTAVVYPSRFIFESIYFVFFLLLACCCIEAVLLTIFGMSPGKKLLGIKLIKKDHQKIDFMSAFVRSFRVIMRGMCFGFSFLSLGAMFIAYWSLNKSGITTWDRDGGFIVQHEEPSNWRIFLVLTALIALGIITGVVIVEGSGAFKALETVKLETRSVII